MQTSALAPMVAIGMLLAAHAHAADPVQKCTAAKIKAAGKRAACLASTRAKEAVGKEGDATKCEGAFATARQKADAAAAKKNAACRLVDNGDGTVSDLDTLLMWEQKTAANVDDVFAWPNATGDTLSGTNGTSADGEGLLPSLAGYHDWRLPNLVELETIVDFNSVGCGAGSPCIAAVFALTRVSPYWSATTDQNDAAKAWTVNFGDGVVGAAAKASAAAVRVVRGGP